MRVLSRQLSLFLRLPRHCRSYLRPVKVTTSGVPVRAGLYDLDAGFEGVTAAGVTMFHAPTTPEIAHDASAADVEEILETLSSLGQVNGTPHDSFVFTAFARKCRCAAEVKSTSIV